MVASAWTSNAQCIPNDSLLHTFSYNGHTYILVKNNKSWADAVVCAKNSGGYLAEINDSAEQAAINNALKSTYINTSLTTAPDGGGASYIWLGGTDQTKEGDWLWDGKNTGTGTLFFKGQYPTGTAQGGNFTNWGNEPDDYGNNQDGLALAITDWPLGTAGHWNDISTANAIYFLVEINSSTGLKSNMKYNFNVQVNQEEKYLDIRTTSSDILTCVIIDMSGRKKMSTLLKSNHGNVDVKGLSNGTYLLQIESVDGRVLHSSKFTLSR